MSSPANSASVSQQLNTSEDSIYHSPQMRKEVLRNKYLNAQALQSNINIGTLENLERLVNDVDNINQVGTMEEKLKDQGEVLLDSEIMSLSSNVLKRCTLSLSKTMNTYDPIEFAQNLKRYITRLPDTVALESDIPDWTLLGKEVINYFRRTPKHTIVLGTLKPIPKQERAKRKVVREAQAPTRRPEKVVVVDKVEESVEQIIQEILKIIRNYQKEHKQPLDFFSLVLHPTDFGKTIENILHVSFLVRDGQIKFSTDEDGIPYVEFLKSTKDEQSNATEAKKNSKTKNIQNVLCLTIKEWKALVEAYQMERPMININTRQ